MAFKNKSMTIGAAIFCLGTLVPAVTGAYAISPMEIYRQARQQNEVFCRNCPVTGMRLICRIKTAIRRIASR